MTGLKRGKLWFVLAAAVMAVTAGTACGPDSSTAGSGTKAKVEADTQTDAASGAGSKEDGESAEEIGVPISVNNDTVELGTLAVFEPSDNMSGNSGVAIAGSDEEQLQQERIAGGAVGEVVSENLEPLYGITDYSEGEYVAVYGVTAEQGQTD